MNTEGIADVFPLLSNGSGPGLRAPRDVQDKLGDRNATSPDVSDELLLIETAKGSREAIALLFRRYQRTVFNIAWRILRDASEAEDLRQEVFLLLFDRAKHYNPDKGKAASWIVQISYRCAIDRKRNLTFRQHYNTFELKDELIEDRGSRPIIDEIFARTLLSRFRAELSPSQQQVLELHFFEGHNLREISEKTNQTLGNTRNHFYRGLEKLRSIVFKNRGSGRHP